MNILFLSDNKLSHYVKYSLEQLNIQVYHLYNLVEPTIIDKNKIDVVVSFDYVRNVNWEREIQTFSKDHGYPYIRLSRIAMGWIIGPIVFPNQSGCLECIENREKITGLNTKKSVIDSTYSFTQQSFSVMATLLISLMKNDQQENFKNYFYIISDKDTRPTRVNFTPDFECQNCGCQTIDQEQHAVIKLNTNLLLQQDSYRTDNPKLNFNNIKSFLCHPQYGLVKDCKRYYNNGIPFSISERVINKSVSEHFIGRSLDFDHSELYSLLECMERISAERPLAKKTVEFHSFTEIINNQAINPYKLSLYTDEQYAQKDFPFVRYDHNEKIRWVWAFSFRDQRPVLVPEQIAYYRVDVEEGKRFIGESSNGCALGGSLEEAILFGIFEVLERDAFLLMWHSRLPLTKIKLDSFDDSSIFMLSKRIESLGFDVYVFDATTEFGIPCIASFAINQKNREPYFFVSGGCHIDPKRAALSSLYELVTHAQSAKHIYKQKIIQLKHLENPQNIKHLDDHYLHYYLLQNRQAIDFLIERPIPEKSVHELSPNTEDSGKRSNRLDILLTGVIERIKRWGFDVLVVNQTPQAFDRFGCKTAKVIIPGTLQLGYGYYGSRALHNTRLLSAPQRLNYTDRLLTLRDLNMHPHPFP